MIHAEPACPAPDDTGRALASADVEPEDVDPTSSVELLRQATGGDRAAREQFFRLVYTDLHRRAAGLMAGQPPGHSLCATALVHECYLKVAGNRPRTFEDQAHFVRTAAKAMRQILVDHARGKNRQKRGGGQRRRGLESITLDYEERAIDMLDLDLALTELAEFDPGMANAVELRFFGGATLEETAKYLGITRRQLEGRWAATRAWLYKRVK